jgi:hypothetical protein
MSRNQLNQRQRTANDPLPLGSFSQTSLRYLTGTLGPLSQVISGGYGGGTYNHWFKVTLSTPGWIIIAKGGPRPKYIQVSAYDLNRNPIESRGVFDANSVETVNSEGDIIHPYVGHVMSAGSDLYNVFNPARLDRGDDMYFPLGVGEYLLCISSTRNERLDYAVGIVIEVADPTPFLLLEDFSRILFEDIIAESAVLLDTTESYTGAEEHEHSLSEWQTAWNREHPIDSPFPEVFVPLTTRP